MLNIEKYKNQIIDILEQYSNSAIGLKDGKPKNCKFIDCEECEFSSSHGPSNNCQTNTILWFLTDTTT